MATFELLCERVEAEPNLSDMLNKATPCRWDTCPDEAVAQTKAALAEVLCSFGHKVVPQRLRGSVFGCALEPGPYVEQCRDGWTRRNYEFTCLDSGRVFLVTLEIQCDGSAPSVLKAYAKHNQ